MSALTEPDRERLVSCDWTDVIAPPQLPAGAKLGNDSDLATCIRNLDQPTEWERRFVVSLRNFPRLSVKQQQVLRGIAAKVHAAEGRP